MQKHAVLLINLGTPDSPEPKSVRQYLKEFLNDPRVIDLPAFFRWILVNLIIIPFRYKKSAHAYQQIWDENGSPLLQNTKKLQAALSLELGVNYQVEIAMRYRQPSIDLALKKFKNYSRLLIVPLFPQYSSAATGSAAEAALRQVALQWNIPEVKIVKDFYHHPGFIAAYANRIKENISSTDDPFIVFSYHGLPERHISKSACNASCDHVDACPAVDEYNAFCYRAQCYATSHLIAQQLGLAEKQYTVSFQSRLGMTPWIKPYTDLLLPKLIQQGISNIAIVCPSFVADCLETLEEINMRAREQWKQLGGNNFIFIPCINASPLWVNALADMIKTDNFQ